MTFRLPTRLPLARSGRGGVSSGGVNPPLPDFTLTNFAALSAADIQTQFGWTRTGAATMVDSGGAVVYGAHNLLTFSEQFDNAIWQKSSATVASNISVAPNGTSTADQITVGGANTYVFNAVTVGSTTTYTVSVWIRIASGTGKVYLSLLDGAWASVTTTTCNVTSTWQRFTVSRTVTSGNQAYCVVGQTNALGDGNSVFEVWGAQLNIGAVTEYVPTTSSAIYLTRAQDYTAGVPGLLLEGARTQLAGMTERFENAAWTKNTGVGLSANAALAPDGTTTADLVTEASGLQARHGVYYTLPINTGSGTFTFSAYCKASGGARFLRIVLNTNSATDFAYMDVNLSTGAISNSAKVSGSGVSAASGVVSAAANGFYRVVLTASTSLGFLYVTLATSNVAAAAAGTDYGYVSYTGDGASGFLAWGAQLEAGSHASSYIPNAGTGTVLRARDSADVGPGALFDQIFPPAVGGVRQGTLVIEWVHVGLVGGDLLTISDGTSSNRLSLYMSNGVIVVINRVADVNTLIATFETPAYGQRCKVAISWGPAGVCASSAGSAVQLNAAAVAPAANQARFCGISQTTGGEAFWKLIARTTYATQRTGAALQALSAL